MEYKEKPSLIPTQRKLELWYRQVFPESIICDAEVYIISWRGVHNLLVSAKNLEKAGLVEKTGYVLYASMSKRQGLVRFSTRQSKLHNVKAELKNFNHIVLLKGEPKELNIPEIINIELIK